MSGNRQTPEHMTRRYKKSLPKKVVIQKQKRAEISVPSRPKHTITPSTPVIEKPIPPTGIKNKPIPEILIQHEEEIPAETLDGGYPGLYGEVVTEDVYELKELDFIPDVVLDLGANIGIFSRYARQLFPDSLIISVEPHPDNIKVFKKYTKDKRIILIEKGIGKGSLYRSKKAVNGSAEVYLSENSAFKEKTLKSVSNLSKVKSIMLTDLKKHIKNTNKVICKIDIEGNETRIFDDKNSMDLLKTFDYVTIELHYFGMTPNSVRNIKKYTKNKLVSFNETHDIKYNHPLFYATKK